MPSIKEAVERIKSVGPQNARKVPKTNGTVDIQILQGGTWVTVLESINAGSADDIIRQASNKVILG